MCRTISALPILTDTQKRGCNTVHQISSPYDLTACRDFEDRFSIVEEKLPAIEMVRKASLNKIGRFTKQDIRELCPSLRVSSIEGSLRKLIDLDELKREGKGKGICYYRLK